METALLAILVPILYVVIALNTARYMYRHVTWNMRDWDDKGQMYFTRTTPTADVIFFFSVLWPLVGAIWLSYKYVTMPPRKKGVEKSEADLEAVNADLEKMGIEK